MAMLLSVTYEPDLSTLIYTRESRPGQKKYCSTAFSKENLEVNSLGVLKELLPPGSHLERVQFFRLKYIWTVWSRKLCTVMM